MHFLYSDDYELTACTCLEHYLLIFRRLCIYVYCQLAECATTVWCAVNKTLSELHELLENILNTNI
jgi:hypothetical protein